jgi:hypothetical protein
VTASPSQFFDASSSRPGGSPIDPATDPWGVRRAENLLTSLEGILSARVVTTPLGEVSEIHILAQAGQAPKQVVRNIESALLAHLGLRVDHRKISVAQTADARPIEASEPQAAPARESAIKRAVLFDDLVMATAPGRRKVTATVTLSCDGRLESATEEGPDTARNKVETAARAAVAVLERLAEKYSLALEGAQVHEAFDRTYVMVGVHTVGGREAKLLVGTAEVVESAEHAAVYAVLDATNRWFAVRRGR